MTATATAVDQEIKHLHDLLLLRNLLADRGAAKDELQQYEAVIAKARKRLAEVAQSDASGLAV